MCLGSPPHTRGKLYDHPVRIYPARITPAYAGKTHSLISDESALQDHPRIRGENTSEVDRGVMDIGSPPHTRGKHSGFT